MPSMAQTFGEPSRDAAEESLKRSKRLLAVAFVAIAAFGLVAGYACGAAFPISFLSFQWALAIAAILFVLMWLIGIGGTRRIDEVDRERMLWRKGAVGENLIAGVLEELPDEFVVIHDVFKRFGNLDHVVIGPTGVYLLEIKNWRGTIKPDSDGELLINGKRVDKAVIKNMHEAVMDFQKKLKALAEKDYFVRGLMVFPNAYVEGKMILAEHMHCLREESLLDYFQDMTFANTLGSEDIERIKRATLQLAGMDERFKIA